MVQADMSGNVNVSKFAKNPAGAGGFINISRNARKVIFLGTFTAGGLEVAVKDGELRITQEGKAKKFVRGIVEHITFSGKYAVKRGRKVMYITERCVFSLTAAGLKLVEIAPGIDLQHDILDNFFRFGYHLF